MNVLKSLRHHNIMKLFEEKQTQRHYLYYMEICQGGDILGYVRRRRCVQEPIIKSIFQQVLSGLTFLHNQGYLHRDLRLDNIFIDNEGIVKISGFKHAIRNVQPINGKVGNIQYMAPEMLMSKQKYKQGYGTSVDVWAAGVILYAMVYGKFPF